MANRPSRRLAWLLGAIALTLLGLVSTWRSAGRNRGGEPVTSGTILDAASASASTLTIEVIDGETRRGIPNAQIDVLGRTYTADRAGRIAVQDPAAIASAATWLPSAQPRAEGFMPAREEALADQTDSNVRRVLYRACEVRGQVVGPGAPVEGARLSLLKLSGPGQTGIETWELETKSAADGSFVLRVLPGRMRVLAEADGFALGESRELHLVFGASAADVLIDLTSRGSVRITVREANTQPVAATVEALAHPTWRLPEVKANAQGEAVVSAVPVGDIRFRVSAEGFRAQETESIKVEVDREARLVVVLIRNTGLFGRVVSAAQNPVPGAEVVAISTLDRKTSGVRSDEQGRFELAELVKGRYELHAAHPHHGPSAPLFADPESDSPVEIVLLGPGSISGRVLTTDGRPLPRFWVLVEQFVTAPSAARPSRELGRRHFAPKRFEDAGGAFTFEGLAPGRYDLYAEADELGAAVVTGIEVAAGQRTDGVTIHIARGGSIGGTVRNAQSRDLLPQARVLVSDDARRGRQLPPLSTETNELGRFEIHGLLPGRRALETRLFGFVTALTSGIQVAFASAVEVQIALAPIAPGGKPQTEFFGIGSVLEGTREGMLIKQTLPGSPSERLGLLAGDYILRVDGQETQKLGLPATVELIRGEQGAPIELEILRSPDPYPFRITLERGRVVYEDKE